MQTILIQSDPRPRRPWSGLIAASLLVLVASLEVQAFPPAPPHTIFGTVRDQIGHPLSDGAEVILEAASGVKVRGFVLAREEPGVNYELVVPMDAGLTSDLYSPTALRPAAPFKIRVMVGRTSYLPMEMTFDFARLGVPGGRTRMDLTLGVDADGNGIPDAWERAVAAFLGRPYVPGGIDPNAPYPGSGLTYREVYLTGTYAVDPEDGFALRIAVSPDGSPRLAFTAVKGRVYTLQAASELGRWFDAAFRTLPAAGDAPPVMVFEAGETRRVEIEPPVLPDEPARFFRLLVR